MHPNVKKYAAFKKLHQKFEAECEKFEKDFRAFTQQVEQFQKTIDKWVQSNKEIMEQMPVPVKGHVSHLVEIMKKGTELSHAMSHLYSLQSVYLNDYRAYSEKLIAMSSNRSAGQLMAGLPNIKAFSKKNHLLIKTKIAVLKTEKMKVEKLYNELELIYKKSLS